MEKKRIEGNLRDLKIARDLLVKAFEDLKNEEGFRNHPNSGPVVRKILMGMVDQIIVSAEGCLKGRKI